jgi:hypothetical protein
MHKSAMCCASNVSEAKRGAVDSYRVVLDPLDNGPRYAAVDQGENIASDEVNLAVNSLLRHGKNGALARHLLDALRLWSGRG